MYFLVLLLGLFGAVPSYVVASEMYQVKACITSSLQDTCALKSISLRKTQQPVSEVCEETVDQKGSVSWADLILPKDKVLMVEVSTSHPSLDSSTGFFVRPTRRTREWGKAKVTSKTATFYIAGTGQFSVEFAPPEFWRKTDALSFDALMLFVNPQIDLPPTDAIIISPDTTALAIDLGPNRKYVFTADNTYDWGRDQVFKVHDNTEVYFESGAYVRARIVQTEKKVRNILISGYGVLDTHYDLEPDLVGISDDATQQTIGIYGKNIHVHGITILNTNPNCGAWGYCLNLNANWSPIGDPNDPFGADELQDQSDPPKYKFRQAHCQENNMDDSPNTNFDNCPTSQEDGQKVSFVKCMTWSMGQDGVNAGKFGSVENSFIRVIDDAIKPWDSYGVYSNITIWQQTLGWPINFGWWNWNQPDINTVVEDIFIIHNHNWYTSAGWPETSSGQCTIGGIYGSGAVKRNYTLRNIFVETAASCAVGLEISKSAYSRHPTVDKGCVANFIDFQIDGLFFDEEFKGGTGYGNFISGESNSNEGCTGDLSGKIENFLIKSDVAGRTLGKNDFDIPAPDTVTNLLFSPAFDPHPIGDYFLYPNKNAYEGSGASLEIDSVGVIVTSSKQCMERCHSDWSCDCVVFEKEEKRCWKRRGCEAVTAFDDDTNYDVFVRPWTVSGSPPSTSSTAATFSPTKKPTLLDPTTHPTKSPSKITASPSMTPLSITVAPTSKPTQKPTKAPTAQTSAEGGFDWGEGCKAGNGTFAQSLPTQMDYADVGVIPLGKYNIRVYLNSEVDIDITLFDMEDTNEYSEGKAIVAWCSGDCNKGVLGMSSTASEAIYKGMQIKYSGYNGVDGKRGNEYIEISGETTTMMMMKAFAYRTGTAAVAYNWGDSQSDCCLGVGVCGGSFLQSIPLGEVVTVGEIPVGKRDVFINLRSDTDVDIQVYDTEDTTEFDEGRAIVAWCAGSCNKGILSGSSEASALYPVGSQDALLYTYSGYNGQYNEKGNEFIRIKGTTSRKLLMTAYGYRAGMANVTYTYM